MNGGRVGEFDLIRRWFMRPGQSGGHADAEAGVVLGIGDDCALLAERGDNELAVSTDMLVAGRHFLDDVDPEALGWKALAVNLSDLAAIGARPRAFTLALALPDADPGWLDGFARGLFDCADHYGCRLIGGDTTRGPLNLCITIFGDVPVGRAIRRDGAVAGDDVWVSGVLGDAALGLRMRRGELPLAAGPVAALERPRPRVELGLALRGIASAMLDVSDGLAGDLGHVLAASRVGARIDSAALPLSGDLRGQPPALQLDCALCGGDDYELCFSAPFARRASIADLAARLGLALTRIGAIEEGTGLRVVDATGATPPGLNLRGYDHFG